ncbi:hypothetical protein GVI59_12100 [Acetobacter sicerae]|nr:hypothetical protein [Acetobacter sicerae]
MNAIFLQSVQLKIDRGAGGQAHWEGRIGAERVQQRLSIQSIDENIFSSFANHSGRLCDALKVSLKIKQNFLACEE